jgi:hypothetical protein
VHNNNNITDKLDPLRAETGCLWVVEPPHSGTRKYGGGMCFRLVRVRRGERGKKKTREENYLQLNKTGEVEGERKEKGA